MERESWDPDFQPPKKARHTKVTIFWMPRFVAEVEGKMASRTCRKLSTNYSLDFKGICLTKMR